MSRVCVQGGPAARGGARDRRRGALVAQRVPATHAATRPGGIRSARICTGGAELAAPRRATPQATLRTTTTRDSRVARAACVREPRPLVPTRRRLLLPTSAHLS